ncbi:MAG: V-type ATPase 116kDa subunit family protein [Candidatus Altiarchaeota archaeon]|nr:V-type ATPase 116kDa subunit family protein [Candidatus Altiarchaeota archaeon]
MFKPVSMKKVRLGVLDRYVEDVSRELSKLGVVQILDITKSEDVSAELTGGHDGSNSERCADYLRRINHVIDILGVVEEYDAFGELKDFKEKIIVKEKPFSEQLIEVKNTLAGIEKKLLPIHERLLKLSGEAEQLLSDRKELQILGLLEVDADILTESQFLYTLAGVLPFGNLKLLGDELEGIVGAESILLSADEMVVDGRVPMAISIPVEKKEKLDDILNRLDFSRVSLSGYVGRPDDVLAGVDKRLKELVDGKRKLIKQLENYRLEHTDDLLVIRELMSIEKDIADVGSFYGRTKRVYILEGWVPEKRIQDLLRRIRRVTDENVFIRIGDPGKDDVIPTSLDNPRIFKPFEIITRTFGFPGYAEIDPTPLIAVTFPLIFGLMFGDVGHGLIVALVGFVLFVLGRNALRELGFVTLSCGVFSAFFGLMYGDFFGLHHIVPIVWISPVESPKMFLMFAIIVGMTHIGVGLFMDMLKLIRKKEYLHAILRPVPKIWFYYGVIAFGYICVSDYGMNVMQWSGNLLLAVPLFLLPLLVIALEGVIVNLVHKKEAKLPTLLFEGGFEVFDTILLFLSNTISYSRIFALVLVHAGMFLALYNVSGIITGVDSEHLSFSAVTSLNGLFWFLIIFVGTLFIVGLEGFIVFLHTLRLHYYEWFTKFFDADGAEYSPFTVQRMYTSTED